MESVETMVVDTTSELDAQVESRLAKLKELKTEHEAEGVSLVEETARIVAELKAEGIDASRFQSLKESERSLTQKHLELEESRLRLTELRTSREELIRSWTQASEDRRKALDVAAGRANEELRPNVRVKVVDEADLSELESTLRSYTSGSGPSTAMTRLRASEAFSYSDLARSIREGVETLETTYGLTPVSARAIAAGGEELALAVELLRRPLAVTVELNVSVDADKRVWKPLDDLSAGQKATAVLLLLLYGVATPLVIDQPEDDLDNRFIAGPIVEAIRRGKRSRQLVFATHNANVPVLGDAEQIVCLTPTAAGGLERTEICDGDTGSIDSLQIQKKISDWLEGGHNAFDLRRRKYGF